MAQNSLPHACMMRIGESAWRVLWMFLRSGAGGKRADLQLPPPRAGEGEIIDVEAVPSRSQPPADSAAPHLGRNIDIHV